jgi:hypothetical protein
MKRISAFSTALLFCAGLALTGATAEAQTCQPGLSAAFVAHQAAYTQLLTAIAPQLGNLNTELAAVSNQATYQTLLNRANTLAGGLTSGRVVVTLPDGTVVLDTARDDNTADPKNNSFQHFQDKTINENHNSRVAIFTAQEYPCGVALETKFSSSTGQREVYLAVRLGGHLDSNGTARISVKQ